MRRAFVALFALLFTLGVVAANADVNQDRSVDLLDLVEIVGSIGDTNSPHDVNSDGIVDILDLIFVVNSFGPVPTTCATDVLTCSDGSTLTRDPNDNCEFPSCPTPTGTPQPVGPFTLQITDDRTDEVDLQISWSASAGADEYRVYAPGYNDNPILPFDQYETGTQTTVTVQKQSSPWGLAVRVTPVQNGVEYQRTIETITIPALGTQACATDVSTCPDGSTVSRDPTNNCNFYQCPPPQTGPVCGQNGCESGETCHTCPGDCGACPPPPPAGQGWSPQGNVVCDVDFTQYSTWASFMAGAPCVQKGDFNGWGRNNVNVEVSPLGYGTTGQGLWQRYRAKPLSCTDDQFAGQGRINLPAGSQEFWVEWTAVFSPNWDTRNSNCQLSSDYKFVLVFSNQNSVSCGERRADFKLGSMSGDIIHASTLGYFQCDDIPIGPVGTSTQAVRHAGNAPQYWDGQPHVYRFHSAMLGNGQYRVYAEIDGVVTHDYTTNSINDPGLAWSHVMFPANRNLGATEDMFIWWKDIKVWAR